MAEPLPDSVYVLPAFIEDINLRAIYEVLVQRMRDESRDLRMSVVQELLLERIAYNYCVLRWREGYGFDPARDGVDGLVRDGFTNAKYQKEYNTFWLEMTREWNRLTGFEKAPEGPSSEDLMRRVGQALAAAFDGLHPDVAGPMRQRVANALQNAGL